MLANTSSIGCAFCSILIFEEDKYFWHEKSDGAYWHLELCGIAPGPASLRRETAQKQVK
jgi:hypothetical protein